MAANSDSLHGLALDFAWSLWGELGVRSSVTGGHELWSIDPEPLMLFTAALGERDPRLRDESLGWCIQNRRYLSAARLRGLVRRANPATATSFGPYAATLGVHTRRSWPGATEPGMFQPRLGDEETAMARPALVRVRLRAIFGVSARAEILHAFLGQPDLQATAAQLARLVGYTKRNVQEELDRLHAAGLVQVAAPTHQFIYRLRDREGLLGFCGARPAMFPNWEPLLRAVDALLRSARAHDSAGDTVRAIELERAIAAVRPDLGEANIDTPAPIGSRRGDPRKLDAWAFSVLSELSTPGRVSLREAVDGQ